MSLTDLRGEVLEKIEETLRFWDERERVSLDITWGTRDGRGQQALAVTDRLGPAR